MVAFSPNFLQNFFPSCKSVAKNPAQLAVITHKGAQAIRSSQSACRRAVSRLEKRVLKKSYLWFFAGLMLCPGTLFAQIDPDKRELIQFGVSQPLEGESPLSAYAFYYYNKPSFLDHTNLTLRLAIAPVYVDSELGISHLLGPNTDLGIGLAGGGFADSYYELRQGKYYKEESFDGHGVTPSASIYHLFDPGREIPLTGVLRGEFHYADYVRDDTDPNFVLPNDMEAFNVRAGFRFGGKEPVLVPALAMELSIWYEGQFRLNPSSYGYANDRRVEANSHLFWGRALLAYTLPESKQNFLVNLTAGTSASADRFSAYRIGGLLPLASEFPLSLPGYFYQELSATRFALLNVNYSVPLDPAKRFAATAVASTSVMSYLPGLEQSDTWNSGVGGGLSYHSTSDAWQILLDYGYGFDAIRTHGRGAQSVGLLIQINLERTHSQYYNPNDSTGVMRGLSNFAHSIY
jgi:hypothetical protein